MKERPTPNCLKTMETLPWLSRPAGTGNSPPARNFAVSPETAVRFGSASVCTRPTVSSAFIVPCRLLGTAGAGRPSVSLRRADAEPNLRAGKIAERLADQPVRIGGRGGDRHAVDHRGAGEIDAELLGDLALHFGDAHFQHHLLAAGDLQHVDDLGGIAGEARRQILRARRRPGRSRPCRLSTTLSFSAETLTSEPGSSVWMRRARSVTSFSTRMSSDRSWWPAPSKKKALVCPVFCAKQEDAPRRAHHGVDDVGIGNQHVARIGVDLDDRRLVERQRQALVDRPLPTWVATEITCAVPSCSACAPAMAAQPRTARPRQRRAGEGFCASSSSRRRFAYASMP